MPTTHTAPAVVVSRADAADVAVLFRALAKGAAVPAEQLVVHIGTAREWGLFCRLLVQSAGGVAVPHWAVHASRRDLILMGRQLAAAGHQILEIAELPGYDEVIADIPAVARPFAAGQAWDLVELPDNTDALCASCDRRYSFVGRAAVMASTRSGRVPLCNKCAHGRHRYAAAANRLYPGAN